MMTHEALRVLVVDDDASARALYRKLLTREGYEVIDAADGADALNAAAQAMPHVIVMDAVMPNMDGLECTRRMKASLTTRDIPVIMASALTDTADVVAGLEAGADEYVAKPIRLREFLLRVRSMARLRCGSLELIRSNEVRGEQARVLTHLLDFCRELSEARTLDAILDRLVTVTADVLCSRRVCVMLPDEDGTCLRIAKSVGIDEEVAAGLRIPMEGTATGEVFRSRIAVVCNTEAEAQIICNDRNVEAPATIPTLLTALGSWESAVGVLDVTGRLNNRPFAAVELEYIDLIASVAAAAIHDCIARQARDDARDSVVDALATLAEHRDVETGRHLERVTRYSLMLAEALRTTGDYSTTIDSAFLRNLRRAVPLHDIGKVAVPDHILLKPGKLTPAEMAIMRTHTNVGAATIRSVVERARGARFLAMAEEVAHGHHEWYDGAGYPRGLSGKQIPLAARIVALADVYDALTTKRVYKAAFSHEKAATMILQSSGTQFDPAVVDAFLQREDEFAATAAALADDVADPKATDQQPTTLPESVPVSAKQSNP